MKIKKMKKESSLHNSVLMCMNAEESGGEEEDIWSIYKKVLNQAENIRQLDIMLTDLSVHFQVN